MLALCEAALKVLEGLGTEIVDVDPGVRRGPRACRGSPSPWRATSASLGHLRGTDDWERLDPGHVALIDHFGATDQRAPT